MPTTMCAVFFSVHLLALFCLNVYSASTGDEDGYLSFPDDLRVRPMGKSSFLRQHHHHHYYHHGPDFYHHHHGFEDFDIEERDRGHENEDPKSVSNTSLQIPLEFIKKLNQYNVSDLLLDFLEDGENKDVIIQDRFGNNEGKERSAATIPKGAPCIPELQTVKIAYSDDPSVMFIPECTRIERCGGCCSHTLLSCQPETKEDIAFKVIKAQYTGLKKLKVLGKEVISVEKHTKCKCDCRVQPEDCNRFQEYRKNECRCACKNHDEEKKCYKNNARKLWNPDLCACQCREVVECSTNSVFDQIECKCVAVPLKRRFANYARITRPEPAPIVPLDEDF